MKLTVGSKSNALYPLLHFVLDDLPTKSKTPELSWCVGVSLVWGPLLCVGCHIYVCRTNLKKALEGTGVYPRPVQDLMGVYLAYLVR